MNIFIVGATYSALTGETERPKGCDDLLPVERTYTTLKVVFASDEDRAKGVIRQALDRPDVTLISLCTVSLQALLEAGGTPFHASTPDPSVGDLRDALVIARKWMLRPGGGTNEVLGDVNRVDWIMRKWGVEGDEPEPERCPECDTVATFDRIANRWGMDHTDDCPIKPKPIPMVPRFYPKNKPMRLCANCNGNLKHDERSCPWCGFPVAMEDN